MKNSLYATKSLTTPNHQDWSFFRDGLKMRCLPFLCSKGFNMLMSPSLKLMVPLLGWSHDESSHLVTAFIQ